MADTMTTAQQSPSQETPSETAPTASQEATPINRESVVSTTTNASLNTYSTALQSQNENSRNPTTARSPIPSIVEPPSRNVSVRQRGAIVEPGQRSSFVGSVGGWSAVQLTPEDELLSLKVRSLYDSGVGSDVQSLSSRRVGYDSDTGSAVGGRKRMSRGVRNSLAVSEEEAEGVVEAGKEEGPEEEPESEAVGSPRRASEEMQLAGGMEDWENIKVEDVDRYGFITPTAEANGTSTPGKSSNISLDSPNKKSRRKELAVLTQGFQFDKPGDMLESPMVWEKETMKAKELQRARKWTLMARARIEAESSPAEKTPSPRPKPKFPSLRMRQKKPSQSPKIPEDEQSSEQFSTLVPRTGLDWTFDVTNPKLVSRTWKGIPDCWRAAAWHSFLTTSAQRRGTYVPDADLIATYSHLLTQPSADDVQIDLDVPRTISSHIMFRRRYRGGQRLLFRVLHAASLYFPQVGYVQGMASPAATLLCYFDEEMAFVMFVRMFEVRGLARLFAPGFAGLREALGELESRWLKGREVVRRLDKLGVAREMWGTKWYLTLFNYSIPFAAQLRVWDVYMLLGDPYPSNPPPTPAQLEESFMGTLDPLHAVSTALLDGLSARLLRADFEEAMTILTAVVDVRDEETLMKLARAEWKKRRRKGLKWVSTGGGGLREAGRSRVSLATRG